MVLNERMKTPLEKAIELCGGSQVELSRRIGPNPSLVGAWMNRFNKRVGDGYVLKVSEAVEWKVTPHELRPDLYPHPDDGLPHEMRRCVERVA